MRLGLALTLAIAAIAPSWASLAATTLPPDGSWFPMKLTPELSTLLFTSLANETLYASGVTPRVCMKEVTSVEVQQVAGKNYRFTGKSCDISKTLSSHNLLHPSWVPPPAMISQYLGQCTPEFAVDCTTYFGTVTIYRRYDKTIKVTQINMYPRTKKPPPTPPPRSTPPAPGSVHAA